MATAYTSLLGLALPVTGELSGTWGDTVNNAITSLLDSAVAGTTTLSTDADVTLTTTTGATNQARQAILLCSGARTAIRNITAPAQSKMYVVINNTTGGYGVVIRGAGPTTGVTVANGKTAVVVWNGSDFVEVAPATATTATNLAGGAAGSLPYQSGAGATTFLSIGTNNFVLTSNGTAPVWTTNTGTGNVVRATSPTLVAPVLGIPTSGTLTNCTGLPISTGVSGLGANVATFLTTPSSANLAAAVTDETGSGALVFGTSPTIATPTFTTSATFPLHIGGTGTTSTLTMRSTSGVGTTGADIIFQTGNNGATEAMRILNSGNLGVGTASPGTKLDAAGVLRGTFNSLSNGGSTAHGLELRQATTNSKALVAGYSTGGNQVGAYVQAVNFGVGYEDLVLQPQGGNLGLGVTPSAWSLGKALEVGFLGNAVWGVGTGQIDVTQGAYYNGGWKYANSVNAPSSYEQYQGAHLWFTAPSGTAGNAITFTQAMTLDASGNLLVGATSGSSGITLERSGSSSAEIKLNQTGTSGRDYRISSTGTGYGSAGNLIFYDATAGAERARIDSAGNVGIGTASPVNKLQVNGSFGRNAPVTKTASFTLADTENWLICNGTGTITVTLPAASSWTGREVMIKTIAAFTVVSASSNVVPLAGGAVGTAILAASAGAWATLVSDGTNWIIMQAN